MKAFLRAALLGVTSVLAVLATLSAASAQSWPQRNVKFVLSLGPGSGADIGARLLAESLQKTWGQAVVVENKPGGDSITAINTVISANDDHTLFLGPTSAMVAHPYLHAKMPYDPAALVPVARISSTLVAIAVPTSLGVTSLAELVAKARSEPGKLNWISSIGLLDIMLEGFIKSNKLEMVRVPYRDFVQSMNDLSEGRVHVFYAAYAIARPQAQAGKAKVIALANSARADAVPGVPTAREAGFPELELDGLVGIFAPRAIPAAVIDKIGTDVIAAAKAPDFHSRMTASGQVALPGTPAEFSAAIDRQRKVAATAAALLGLKVGQ